MRCLALSLILLAGACEEPRVAAAPSGDAPPRAAEFRSPSVARAVDAASEVVQTRGFAAQSDDARGFLVEHATEARETPMRSGTCYVAVAAGSSAMRELDLRIYDADGVEVASDTNDGARAALLFCPTQTGTYYLTTRASAGSGLYQLRTFRGPTGLDIRTDDLFREAPPAEPPREGR